LRGSGHAEQFFEAGAVALGAMRFFVAADEELEIGRAAFAMVFVEGHFLFLRE
jgi:hypothetical protein